MAYRKYELNGKTYLVLDNLGLVDYDKYYLLMDKTFKKRVEVIEHYLEIQRNNKIDGEPDISHSSYDDFMAKLKKENPEMHEQKRQFVKEYVKKLNEIEIIDYEEKNKLLEEGFRFDNNLKKFGYYVFKDGNNYYKYGLINHGNYSVDMGKDLFPMQAEISSWEITPISEAEYYVIKSKVKKIKFKMANRKKELFKPKSHPKIKF